MILNLCERSTTKHITQIMFRRQSVRLSLGRKTFIKALKLFRNLKVTRIVLQPSNSQIFQPKTANSLKFLRKKWLIGHSKSSYGSFKIFQNKFLDRKKYQTLSNLSNNQSKTMMVFMKVRPAMARNMELENTTSKTETFTRERCTKVSCRERVNILGPTKTCIKVHSFKIK